MSRATLDINVQAPDFSLVEVFGRTITLSDYRGKRVFLGFFRHAGCPFCNLRVHALQKQHEALRELNMEMIFFFESKKRLLLTSTFHKEVNPIPIISDPEKVWYDTYGIETSGAKSAKSHLTSFIQQAIKAKLNKLPVHPMKEGESISTIPAEFLIDEEGVIRNLHYCNGLTDRMKMDHLYQFARKREVA
ncbi:MAG TPA: alkyl hydroperoxide reductase [Cytophagales bacterium]|nr:alkyl hydroperoxide reductase [Cytophagales bacterium]